MCLVSIVGTKCILLSKENLQKCDREQMLEL